MLRPLLPLNSHLPLLDTTSLRQLEQRTTALLPSGALMERAGLAAARLARARWPQVRRVRLLCGPGNNGGDALVMARLLHEQGLDVRVWQAQALGQGPADRKRAEQLALDVGVPMLESLDLADAELLVDGLLGIGLRAEPRGQVQQALTAMAATSAPRLALDLPSGLDADEGRNWGAVACTATISFLAAKPGLFSGAGRSLCGELWLDDLDVGNFTEGLQPRGWANGGFRDWRQWSPRAWDAAGAHKGQVGQVWVASGASSMAGATLLAGSAALASGAGRVYLAGASATDSAHPELMTPPLDTALHALPAACAVVGCGGGKDITQAMPAWLALAAQLVLDADGLNAVARDPTLEIALRARAERGQRSVITPHPLEAARLLKLSGADAVQASRLQCAQELARRFACCVVLKGSGTVIAAPNTDAIINVRGHSALATAGTGDVLSGWLGGLMAQAPLAPLQTLAAIATAWHGAAAEQWPTGGGPARATALIEAMAALHP